MLRAIGSQLRSALFPTMSMACDNIALNQLQSFGIGYLPWTGAAIRPAALCSILNEIIINQRLRVVEFGAGISTIYIGRVLKERGGAMTSFEHDRCWYDLMSQQLERQRLDETVNLVYAPLEPCEHSLGSCKWYDSAVVRSHVQGSLLDGIVVDGPPASSAGLELSRYPALPVLKTYLAEEFFVYLDDIGRQGERDIFGRWETLLDLEGTIELVAGNYGVLRRGGQFATAIKH